MNYKIILLLVFSISMFAISDEKDNGDGNDEETFDEYLEKFSSYEGFFNLYRDEEEGKVYLLINEDQLDNEFIYFAHILDGVVEAGSWRGNYLDNGILKFNKYFDQIRLIRVNTGYYFDETNALSKSRNANISDSVIESLGIVKTNKEKNKILIEVTSLFLSEALTKIHSPRDRDDSDKKFSIGSISRSKSSINNIYNYPENSDIEIDYVFNSPSNEPENTQDKRNNSVKVRYSFISYPDEGFETRFENQNIGYFTEQVTDLTSIDITPYRDLINKWRLEKKDPAANLSPPIKPIKFWIENSTPLELRELIKDAALQWNIAFEKAGFINAIEIDIQPDDAQWDAGDIRYNTIRWTSSPNPLFGGYGPSFTNPRTGEILGADIMLEWIYLTNRIRYSEIFDDTKNHTHCEYSSLKHENKLFASLAAKITDGSVDELDRLYKEDLYQLILHEIGHTLGLNHNFAASTLHDNNDIHNPEVTYEEGLSSSVMDYHALNIAPKGKPQGQYADIKPGKYDILAIRYGYTPNLTDQELSEIISLTKTDEYLFGNDADDMRSPGKGIDPRINTSDMTNSPMDYAYERILLSQSMIPELYEKLKTESDSWESIYQGYRILLRQIHVSAEVISRQVGGIYVSRSQMEDKNKPPYSVVPYTDQKKALKLLAEVYFNNSKMVIPKKIAERMQRERRGFEFYGETEDPKIHKFILNGQKKVLRHFTNSKVLKRLTDSSLYGNKYLPSEMLDDLTNAIFNNNNNSSINSLNQNLQDYYVSRLLLILNSVSFDSPSSAAAFVNLKKINSYLFSPSSDKNTEYHKELLRWKISKALGKTN